MRFHVRPLAQSFILWALYIAAIGVASGQATVNLATGVHGIVKDATGGIVPGATVNLISDVSPTQPQTTGSDGSYSFTGLRSGTYKVTVSYPGFQNFTGKDIELLAGQVGVQDVNLTTAAAATQSLDVNANAASVETADPSVLSTITSKEITGLQLNGRNFIQLMALAPGVTNQSGQDEAKVGVQGSASFSVNGGRVEYNNFTLDGTDLLNTGFNGGINTLIVYPSLDAIGELKVLTSNYGAQYGRTASGTIIVNTKSGTNQFHGDGYEFIRNEALNARNFFDETHGAPLYRRYDMGMTLGGPLYIPHIYNTKKEKTFFFISEEYRSEVSPYEFNQGVPSAAERAGNFSDVCPAKGGSFYQVAPLGVSGAQVYPDCPGIIQPNGLRTTYPKNNIYTYNPVSNSGTYPSQNAAAILSTGVIPLPNSTVGCNSSINSCYVNSVSEPTHWREELGRIDHYFNDQNRATFRYIHDAWSTINPNPVNGIVTNSFPTIENNFTGPGTSMVGRFSQTLSPSMLNEAYLSYAASTVWLTDRNGQSGSTYLSPSALSAPCSLSLTNPKGDCPVGSIFNNTASGKIPGFVFVGGAAYGNGFSVDPSYEPWYHSNPVYSFGDALTKQWKSHFIQTGADFLIYNRTQTNSVSGAATGDTQGLFTITNATLTGNAFANFLQQQSLTHPANAITGAPAYQYIAGGGGASTYQQDSTQLMYHQQYQLGEPYLQDDWKVTPHLTVSMGLRISLFGRYYETNDNVYNWTSAAYSSALASQVVSLNDVLYYKNNSPVNTYPVYYNPSTPSAYLTNGLQRCGYNGVPASCMSGHLFNPAPRVGFAWDPFKDGKTSLRGGYGIFFEHGTGNEANTGSLEGSAPLVLSAVVNQPSALPCVGGSNLVQCNANVIQAAAPGQIAAVPLSLTSIPTKTVWPYAQQWSLSLQRQLPQNIIATLAYVGSKGTHLTAETQSNSLQPVASSQNPFAPGQPLLAGPAALESNVSDCNFNALGIGVSPITLHNGSVVSPGSPGYSNLALACSYFIPAFTGNGGFTSNIDAFRPYNGIGSIVSLNNVANSAYNSLQFTLRRTQGPLTLGLSYTYSHSLDNTSDRFDPVPNAYDLGSNRANSAFDQRHSLTVSYIVDVPKITWSAVTSEELWDDLLNHWQLSGIAVFKSGTPFSVVNDPNSGYFVADNAGVGNGLGVQSIQSYPDLIASKNTAVPSGLSNSGQTIGPLLYNPNIFAPPRGLTFGDSGRDSLNNPFRYNFDLSLFKNIKLGESETMQFRAEAFNLLNNTQFELFNPAKGNQPNNTITCYGVSSGEFTAGAPECLAGSSFLRPVDAHRGRTIQLALKFTF